VTDELLKWRDEFPILEKSVYLISHSLGAMPRGVYDRLQHFADTWATRGVRAWAEGWWEMPVSVGDELAPIIGAAPGTVAMHQNVSVCMSLILSCFPPQGRRNKIVYSSLEFPSVQYVYEAHARDGSYRIVDVPSDDGITVSNERLLEAIDEETLLVPISHVLFKSGFLQDAAAITKRAHEVGAVVVLDTYQSAGTVPFNVTDLDVDMATGGSVKWLCAGPGAGYLYVHPRWHDKLEPKVTGWMAHEHPFRVRGGRHQIRSRHTPLSARLAFNSRAAFRASRIQNHQRGGRRKHSSSRTRARPSTSSAWRTKRASASRVRATRDDAAEPSPSPSSTARKSSKNSHAARYSLTSDPARASASRHTSTPKMKNSKSSSARCTTSSRPAHTARTKRQQAQHTETMNAE
jgi:hypothetical protein